MSGLPETDVARVQRWCRARVPEPVCDQVRVEVDVAERDWTGQHRSTELYDPATGQFQPAGSMHAGRFKIGEAVAVLPTGTAVVAGSDRTVESYNLAAGTFTTASGQLPQEYHTGTATALADGRVLIAGGYDPGIRPTANSWLAVRI